MSLNHHGSHLKLLRSAALDPPSSVRPNAIVVPVAHPAADLRNAMLLARKLECPLVALCSQQAKVDEAVPLAEEIGAELVAIDTRDLPTGLLPTFRSAELLRDTIFERTADTGRKRNLGLLVANLMGWRRIVFLDVDVTVPEPGDLGRAAYLLNRYVAVGLEIKEFPDNSVVCHANRVTGGDQRTFIGGGALAVDPTLTSSFFPDIYNEDWFFLLDGNRLYPTAKAGLATQDYYDPFVVARARDEEFGDCLAEGVFWLLDQGQGVQDATAEYWEGFCRGRLSFIDDVIKQVERADELPASEADILAALYAARERSTRIEPEVCAEYLTRWRADRLSWRDHVNTMCGDHRGGLGKILSALKLSYRSSFTST